MNQRSGGDRARLGTHAIVRYRGFVRGAIILLALGFSLTIPSLETRFAPEELARPDDEDRSAAEEMARDFGRDEDALVVLLEAPDVLAPEMLGWSHGIARFLETQPGIARVESLGTTPLPHARRGEDETLESLALASEEEEARRARIEDAMSIVVAADPSRFPFGLVSLAERGAPALEIAPIAAGAEVSEAERRTLIDVVERNALVRGRLVSESRRLLLVAAVVRQDATEEEVTLAVNAALAQIRDAPPPPRGRAHLAGLPVMRVTMVSALEADQVQLIGLAAIGSLLVLIFGMRTVVGVVLPMSVVGITLALTMGGMAIAGEPINLLSNVIPPLLVTIGLSDAVHLVLRYRDEREGGKVERAVAASRTLALMWRPCLVTALTTAIGFAALVFDGNAILVRFGLIAATGTMISYAVTVTFMPASLPLFDGVAAREDAGGQVKERLDRFVLWVTRITARRPWGVIGCSAVLFAGSLIVSRGVVVDSRLLDQFDPDSEVAEVTRVLERELDGVRGLSIGLERDAAYFWSPQGIAELEQLSAWLRAEPAVLRVTSHADWLHEAWSLITGEARAREEAFRSPMQARALHSLIAAGEDDPLSRFVTEDGARARIEVRLRDEGASRILDLLERFEQRARALGAANVTFSGEAWDASRGLSRMMDSLGGLASAIVMIFVVMTFLFRSLRLGLLSIPPNALPLVMTLAYMALRDIPLHAGTIIAFTVTVGLAVDGATHVIARFREESERGAAVEETLARAMVMSGRGVVLSTATLLVGYGALLLSAFEPVRLFGELSAVAMGGALIAQLVLLPALLVVGAKRSRRAELQQASPLARDQSPTRPSSVT